MSIALFEHNEKAYKAAVSMMKDTGRAAVIHPTGTGKSFIGFKLCEDNPGAKVCWLSPSEYIFRMQLDNLRKSSDFIPENVVFYTYSKLTIMSDEELLNIKPDYIILDEFHRCGAEIWGKRVRKLLDMFKEARVLGLSATNIRYLDNQRDMAEELFDGCIASEMTLGEAIVRGILNAPLYISTVYSYQKDLEKYERKIKHPKFAAVRDKAQRYLEELRRTIEKADGLDIIFEKYMPDKCGKYVVFCANIEHLDEMLSHSSEWFKKVDAFPKIYKVYNDNPDSYIEFTEFKADKSEHLKLLFCIDMLNEGVHLDDIDGVILFRPTVSPVIYKQQIGRALTAGKSGTPVIFDIINNFENLYSVGSIEQEMATAISYYNCCGENEKIFVDRFEVIGIVQNCVELFDKLNDTLSASWSQMYECAKKYYLEHGNLEPPKAYKTENGLSLGNWISIQRSVRKGKTHGILNEERIKLLDKIGMRWEYVSDLNWERNFAAAKKYFEDNGVLCPTSTYVTEDGINLGSWLNNIKCYRKSGIHRDYLTDERIEALDKIGMVWDAVDYYWERNLSAASDYYREKGDLDIPYNYVSSNGVKLGMWIRQLRKQRKSGKYGILTDEKIRQLDEIGMVWNTKYERNWEIGFEHAKEYFKANNNLDVPVTYICEDGFKLGNWINNHRIAIGGTKITDERREKLDSIGMIWQKSDPWETKFSLVKKYYDEYGNIDIPSSYKSDGVWIAKWLDEQRQIYHGRRDGKKLSDEQKKKLESLGFSWLTKNEQIWYDNFEELKKYKSQNGNVCVPQSYITNDGKPLGRWLKNQVALYKKGGYNPEYAQLLISLGVKLDRFSICDEAWMKNYRCAEDYFNKNGNLSFSDSYKNADGVLMKSWISNQRQKYKDGKLDKEKAEMLEKIGMIWDLDDFRWMNNFEAAKAYYKSHGNLDMSAKYVTDDGLRLGQWLRTNRRSYSNGKLNTKRINLLKELGVNYD